jgi:glucosamine--fructose-6-phosphate aminotransferase (isomerizing)
VPVEVEYASEFRYRNPTVDENTLVIAISQSGETADTLAAIREAKQRGARTLGIVNVVGSSIAREVDGGTYLHAGPEIGVASTKAFTCQVAVLALLTLRIGRLRSLSVLQGREIVRALERLPDQVAEVLSQAERVKQVAETFMRAQNALYLGRGYNFPVALEGALKLKEISYIHAEGYPAAEMKQGRRPPQDHLQHRGGEGAARAGARGGHGGRRRDHRAGRSRHHHSGDHRSAHAGAERAVPPAIRLLHRRAPWL